MKSVPILVLVAASVFSGNVYSYKESTHQEFSGHAVKISDISRDPSLLKNLGLEAFSDNQTFPEPYNQVGRKLSILELVRNGAKFEDSAPRFLHHFYNPINEAPLTVGVELGFRSPDWALEDRGDLTSTLAGPQEYSYKEAMDYFYLALTSQAKQVRDQNWGMLFQSLGQVIHHVQDMAQPDHVRNDQHNDATDPSWYEAYTDHLRSSGDVTFNTLMAFSRHPIPEFPTPRDFWTTRAVDPNIADRRGIADFTNRNFVSKDTIFLLNDGVAVPSPEFPLPTPDITPTTVDIADPSIMGAQGQALCDRIKSNSVFQFPASACFIDFVSTPVTGTVTGEPTLNTRAASYSIFDKKLQDFNVNSSYTRQEGMNYTIDRSFTLNKFNFNAAHSYLVPRAVAYSAGLINHFFRGEIEFSQRADVGWFVKNMSGQPMHSGTFRLFYDNQDGDRREVSGASWSIVSPLDNGSEMVLGDIALPADVRSLILVFTGSIGSDMNVVTAKVVDRYIFVFQSIYEKYETEGIASDGVLNETTRNEKSIQIDLGEADNDRLGGYWQHRVIARLPLLNGTLTTDYFYDTRSDYRYVADNYPVVRVHNGKLYVYTISGVVEYYDNDVGPSFRPLTPGQDLIDLDAYSEEGVYTSDYRGFGTQTLTITSISTLLGTGETLVPEYSSTHFRANEVNRVYTAKNYDSIYYGTIVGIGELRVLADRATVWSRKRDYSLLLDPRWDCPSYTRECTLDTITLPRETKTAITDSAFETLRLMID